MLFMANTILVEMVQLSICFFPLFFISKTASVEDHHLQTRFFLINVLKQTSDSSVSALLKWLTFSPWNVPFVWKMVLVTFFVMCFFLNFFQACCSQCIFCHLVQQEMKKKVQNIGNDVSAKECTHQILKSV